MFLPVGPALAGHPAPPNTQAPHCLHLFSLMKYENIPDVRDGLTRKERIVLYVLNETQKERGGHNVPTPMLWGRVCEYFYISPEELSEMLARLGARRY
jgi:hypothetical protein